MPKAFSVPAQGQALNAWVIPRAMRDPVMLNTLLCTTASTFEEWTSRSLDGGAAQPVESAARRNDSRVPDSLYFKGQAIEYLKRQLQVQQGEASISTIYGVFALLSNEVCQRLVS
jgi:hypothetical protein